MFHTNRKDVLSANNLSNVVYLFGCVCGHSYVGRTTQRLGERIRQHIPAEMTNHVATHAVSPVRKKRGRPRKSSPTTLRRSQRLAQKEQVLSAVKPDLPAVQMAICKSDSAITRHLKSSTSCLNAVCGDVNGCFKILAGGRNLYHLSILEALFIARLKPGLCAQKEHVKNLQLF